MSSNKKNVSASVRKTARQQASIATRASTTTTTHAPETIMSNRSTNTNNNNNNKTTTTPHLSDGNIEKERNPNTNTMAGTSTTIMNANSTTTTAPNATMSNMNASSPYASQQQQMLVNDSSVKQWTNLSSNIGGGGGEGGAVDALLNNAHSSNVALTQQHIRNVQSMIENCLTFYMSKEEVENTLKEVDQFVIDLVWQKLEEQNPGFFEAYRLRLQVKEQILYFNKLVSEQANAMRLYSMGSRNCRAAVPQQMNVQHTAMLPPTTMFPMPTDMTSATNTSHIPVSQQGIMSYASQPRISLSQTQQQQAQQQQQPRQRQQHLLSSRIHPSNMLPNQYQNIPLSEQGAHLGQTTSSSSLTSLLMDPRITPMFRNDHTQLLSTMHGEHIDSPTQQLFQSDEESLNADEDEGDLPYLPFQNSLFEEEEHGA